MWSWDVIHALKRIQTLEDIREKSQVSADSWSTHLHKVSTEQKESKQLHRNKRASKPSTYQMTLTLLEMIQSSDSRQFTTLDFKIFQSDSAVQCRVLSVRSFGWLVVYSLCNAPLQTTKSPNVWFAERLFRAHAPNRTWTRTQTLSPRQRLKGPRRDWTRTRADWEENCSASPHKHKCREEGQCGDH